MKQTSIFILGILGFGIFSCEQNNSEISASLVNNPNTASDVVLDSTLLPKMVFTEEYYDFGEIIQGEKVYHSFEFQNTGKTDLVIASATATCGCTVPKWPKKPIQPGQSSKIEVVFDSDHKNGQQNKRVTIVANTQPSTNVVALKGMVIAPEKSEE